jgi:hypothetical protein
MRVDAKTLFNGANNPARLDHVHSSHACSLRRYHAAVERTARAAPYAPPTEAGASRPIFFGEAEITAHLQQRSITAQAGMHVLSAAS